MMRMEQFGARVWNFSINFFAIFASALNERPEMTTAELASDNFFSETMDSIAASDLAVLIVASSLLNERTQSPAELCNFLIASLATREMTAVSISLLTIYDMCKGIDKGMIIRNVELSKKAGGASGTWGK